MERAPGGGERPRPTDRGRRKRLRRRSIALVASAVPVPFAHLRPRVRRAAAGAHPRQRAHLSEGGKVFMSRSAVEVHSQFAGGRLEETMVQRLTPSGVAAAIAGGTMAVAQSCCPSFALTRSAPSLAQSVVKADVEQVDYYGHPYHHAYHHPYYHGHYNNSYHVRHYVPQDQPLPSLLIGT